MEYVNAVDGYVSSLARNGLRARGERGFLLDDALAYLKGNDAGSEEAQEHANSSLALYA